jgi:tetratricopeptide (TPR) repeat protein
MSAAFLLAVAAPGAANAQQAAFIQAISELTTALEGTSGSESAGISAALDRMSAALAAWDREIGAAESDVRAARADDPASIAQQRISLGRMYAARGRQADALAEFGAASRLAPARADLHVLRGLLLKEQGASADAIEAFRNAWALDPGDALTIYYLFHEAMLSGNTRVVQEASATLAAAYTKLPASALRATAGGQPTATPFIRLVPLPGLAGGAPVLPHAGYSEAFRALTRAEYDHAITEFRRASAGDPLLADPAAGSGLIARALDALRQGRLSDAQSLLEQPGLPRDSSEVHRVLGLVYWAKSEYDRSISSLSTAVGLSPRNERARLALARVLNAAGRNAEAERALQDTVAALPDSTLAHWWLALAYEQVNRDAEARRELEQVAAGAIVGQGQVYAAIGRFAVRAADDAGAIDAFARAIRANPNDPAAHRQLANVLVQQDRADEALAEFVAVLLIDPADAAAHAGIGQIHLQAGRDAAAVDALRRATDLTPANGETQYTLAVALERLGRTEEAALHFARAEEAQRQTEAERRRELSAAAMKQEEAARAAEKASPK